MIKLKVSEDNSGRMFHTSACFLSKFVHLRLVICELDHNSPLADTGKTSSISVLLRLPICRFVLPVVLEPIQLVQWIHQEVDAMKSDKLA